MARPRLKVYFGKVCAKHPELKGERGSSSHHCMSCEIERSRVWCEENRETLLSLQRNYREENREAILAYARNYHKENREARLVQKRKHYKENREALLAQARKWKENFKAKHGITHAGHAYRLKKQKEQQQCAI